jgi:hypothetical protein
MGPSSYSSFSGVNVPRVAMAEFAMGLRDAGENILADKILARSTVATSVFHFRLTSEGNWPSRSTIRPANSPSFTRPLWTSTQPEGSGDPNGRAPREGDPRDEPRR